MQTDTKLSTTPRIRAATAAPGIEPIPPSTNVFHHDLSRSSIGLARPALAPPVPARDPHRRDLLLSETVCPYYYAGTMGLVMRDGINRLRHVKRYSGQYSTICVTLAWNVFLAGSPVS